jgi:uncharacterized protein
MNKDLYYRYNPWWEGELNSNNIIERKELYGHILNQIYKKPIVILTGIRRSGKTTAMKYVIKHLIEKENIDAKKIFYISLDDYLLTKPNILEIIDEFRSINRLSVDEKVYLFLDEIAYKKDFEQQLKNIYDLQNTKIFASSSSASILKSKKSYLTGRNMIIEVMPLDFAEYLLFKNIEIKKKDNHLLKNYFEIYMQTGGIPEYVIHGEIEYLKELIDDIIVKDIVSFYGVKNTGILKDMYLLLMERAGKTISINKIAKILKLSPDSARRYLQMFEYNYLIYGINKFGKTSETVTSLKKIYAPDLGIRNYFTGFRDKGSAFENYVFLKLKNRNPRYVLQDGIELDFLTDDKTLIEVKYNSELTEKQKKLFDTFKSRKKIIIKKIEDVENLFEN